MKDFPNLGFPPKTYNEMKDFPNLGFPPKTYNEMKDFFKDLCFFRIFMRFLFLWAFSINLGSMDLWILEVFWSSWDFLGLSEVF